MHKPFPRSTTHFRCGNPDCDWGVPLDGISEEELNDCYARFREHCIARHGLDPAPNSTTPYGTGAIPLAPTSARDKSPPCSVDCGLPDSHRPLIGAYKSSKCRSRGDQEGRRVLGELSRAAPEKEGGKVSGLLLHKYRQEVVTFPWSIDGSTCPGASVQ